MRWSRGGFCQGGSAAWAMASLRQAAVLARRGASRIASSSSSSVRAGSTCVSFCAGSLSEAAPKEGILGAERGFATVAVRRCPAYLTELLIRFVVLLRFD